MKQIDNNAPSLTEKMDLAKRALNDFHAQCFWYLRKDMDLKPSDLDEIVRGLRQNGGRQGFLLAARLCR